MSDLAFGGQVGFSDIVGRKDEQRLLSSMVASKRPEFLVVYGRRRVGKTFLIRSFFDKKKSPFFYVSGIYGGSLEEQLHHFFSVLRDSFFSEHFLKDWVTPQGGSWEEAFEILSRAFSTLPRSKPIIIFFDEFPWMVTRNSKLLQTLDHFWNYRWSRDPRIKLIICGSSASWIIHKIINHRGGLHNRVTRNINLMPFNLQETYEFLKTRGMDIPTEQLIELYMVMGGIPYYLDQLRPELSVSQNIRSLAFSRGSFFSREFENLFSALFEDRDESIEIIKTIADHPYGISQKNLFKKLGSSFDGQKGLKRLSELKETYFIMSFHPVFQKKKGVYYKLIDPFCLFYFRWIAPLVSAPIKRNLHPNYWDLLKKSGEWHAWAGMAFEALCYEHIPKIHQTLELGPLDQAGTWSSRRNDEDKGAQIDLLFDRQDGYITLCEIKYTHKPFVMTEAYQEHLYAREKIFKQSTRTRKKISWALISAHGIKENKWSSIFEGRVVTLKDFF